MKLLHVHNRCIISDPVYQKDCARYLIFSQACKINLQRSVISRHRINHQPTRLCWPYEMDGGNGCTGALGWVKLNVGGQIFLTTKATLAKENDSFLARLSREDPELPSDKVRFLPDTPGPHFFSLVLRSFFNRILGLENVFPQVQLLLLLCIFFLLSTNLQGTVSYKS